MLPTRLTAAFRTAALFLAVLAFSSCASQPAPDAPATEAAIAARIFATLTAAAPTPTPVPPQETPAAPATMQAFPTPLPQPSDTPAPTLTATSTSIPPSPTSTLPPSPVATSTPLSPAVSVKGQGINVRAGPGTAHAVIAAAAKGDALPLLGKTPDGAWLAVQLPAGRTGWVSAPLVEVNVPAGAIPEAQAIPTAPPQLAAKPQPSGRRELEVTYINPHYECEMLVVEDQYLRVWAYRSFQVDMFIRNNSQAPVTPPWRPSRWIITDGARTRQSTMIWQWVKGRGELFPQPVIGPGQVAGWTFLAIPVERNEWVQAVEFEWGGQTYRQAFDLGPLGNAHNYRDCGDYPPNPWPREPIPADAPGPPGPTAPPPSPR